MMTFQTPNPFLYQLRDGSLADPYVDKVETLKPVDGRIVLSELPVKQNGVFIDGHLEIESNIPAESQFYVDYTYGVIYFESTKNTPVTARYKGRGSISLPSDRIFYKKDSIYKSIDAHLEDVNVSVENYRIQLSIMQTQVNSLVVGGDSSPEAAQARIGVDGTDYATLKERIDTEILSKMTGSPKGTYATLAELTNAKPQGDNGIYLITSNGNWCYWTGSIWTSGGVYQSTQLAKQSVTDMIIKDQSVIERNVEFVDVSSHNLINKDTLITGGYYNEAGVWQVNELFYSTDFIKVKKSTNYTRNTDLIITFYNSQFECIDGLFPPNSPQTIYTSPLVSYVKMAFSVLETNPQFNEGFTLKPYDDYKISVKNLALKNAEFSPETIASNALKSKVYGMKWGALGDSITFNPVSYVSKVSAQLGLNGLNYGLNGRSMASRDWADPDYPPIVYMYNTLPDDCDIITVAAGVNDFHSQVPLGAVNSTNPADFYGACNIVARGLIEKFPGKKIAFITPMQRRDFPNPIPLTDYVNAVKVVSRNFGIPCFDNYQNCGLYPNSDLINDMFFGSADGLHPNDAGYKVFSPRIASFIENL